MLKPDFFIVGAPKSGTDALYSYLRQHPEVYFNVKEICYFCPDLTLQTPHFAEDVYLSYYAAATNQKAVGDGYVFHLLSEVAAIEIKAFNPDARILIMLRNPVEMVYSLYSQLVFNGDEPLSSFAEALDAEKDRRVGVGLPEHYRCPKQAFYYSTVAKYYEQVLRYTSLFTADKIHVVFYDDFKQNTALEYKKVLQF